VSGGTNFPEGDHTYTDPERPLDALRGPEHGVGEPERAANLSAGSDASSWGGGRPNSDPPQDAKATEPNLTGKTLEAVTGHGRVNAIAVGGEVRVNDPALTLAETLDLLRSSVRRILARGRRTTAAAVSLEMRRESGQTFTPAAAGFESFRDLLRFAEQLGAVELVASTARGDIDVLLAENPPKPESARPAQHGTVRRDLWQAFVDWSTQWIRAYDVQTNQVVKASTAVRDEASSPAVSDWDGDPVRYRRIPQVTREDQLLWMRGFVDQLASDAEREMLSLALSTERPSSSFAVALRATPKVQREWHQVLSEHVIAKITEWTTEEGLDIDIFQRPTPPKPHIARVRDGTSTTSRLSGSEGSSSDALRKQVLDAVARMPLAELLRLPIPAEYLLLR
jgi:hypothetical protein